MLALALAAPGHQSRAAETSTVDISGGIRLRQESLWGQYRPGPATDHQLALRSTAKLEWKPGAEWELGLEIMDSRAFENGDDGVLSNNEVNTLEPIQAYVTRKFANPFGDGGSASVQLGRFTMNVASRRLIASDDYRNTPNSYTGARADVQLASKATGTLFFVLPQRRRPDDVDALRDGDFKLDREGREQQLWGVTVAQPDLLPAATTGEFSYVGFKEEDRAGRPTRDRDLHNFSLRAIRDPRTGAWDYEAEGIYQTGHVSASTSPVAGELDVDAYFVHLDAGYTFAGKGKPRLSVEYDYASGDGPAADYQRFDSIFGMRRGDLAPSGIYGLVARTNIETIGARLEATPSPRYDLMATWHVLWAADARDSFSSSGIRDASGASGHYAGHQLDCRARYWVVPRKLRAEVNAVWFLRGELMREAPNASPHGDTKYVSAALMYSF